VLNAQGAQQAASALGWKTKTIVPTSASPQQVNAVFRRLIDSRVDAIVWVGFSRTILKPSLDMARAAHIPMVSSQVADGDALDISYGQANAPMEKLGEQVAWWMIADSAGNAKVAVMSDDEFLAGVAIDKGLTRVLGRCSGCRILATKDVTVDRQSTAAAGETTALLQRYPDTKYVFCPFNSRPPFIIQGARAAQRPDVKVGTTKSDSAVLASMKASNEPRLDVTSSVPELWMGWAMVDQLLRVMAKRPLVDHPMPIMLRTPDNVDAPFFQPLSTSDAIDFKSHFKSLWGVK